MPPTSMISSWRVLISASRFDVSAFRSLASASSLWICFSKVLTRDSSCFEGWYSSSMVFSLCSASSMFCFKLLISMSTFAILVVITGSSSLTSASSTSTSRSLVWSCSKAPSWASRSTSSFATCSLEVSATSLDDIAPLATRVPPPLIVPDLSMS